MRCNAGSKQRGLIVIVLVAAVLRLADLPGRYVRRDFDERPYVEGGLALWEGITPTYSYAPAGPQTWISWTYAAASTARYLIFPTSEERAAPLVLRPFIAGNHALFDIYRDWSVPRYIEIVFGGLVAVAGAAAGFLLGWKRGGWMPAILVGGMAAVLPLFIELSGEARPYAMAWGFGIIALCFAAKAADRPANANWSAIFMALAIASRVDMLLLMPLAWADIWDLEPSIGRRIGRVIRYSFFVAVVSLLVSPWLATNLIGNLRAIATVRLAEPTMAVSTSRILMEIAVHQGLAIDLLLVACAIFLTAPDRRRIRWAAAIYVVLLSVSMLKGTGFGLRHQGAPLVAVVTFAGVGMAAVSRRWPRLAVVALAAALAIPAIRAVGDIVQRRRLDVADHAAQWIQRHVPPGTRVYLSPNIHDPLPTVAASNALWAEVNGNAWKKKLDSAMRRFHVSSDNYPRLFRRQYDR